MWQTLIATYSYVNGDLTTSIRIPYLNKNVQTACDITFDLGIWVCLFFFFFFPPQPEFHILIGNFYSVLQNFSQPTQNTRHKSDNHVSCYMFLVNQAEGLPNPELLSKLRHFLHCMESKVLLLCLQNHTIRPYPKPHESNPHLTILF